MRELIMLFSCFSRGVDWNGSQNYVKTIWLVSFPKKAIRVKVDGQAHLVH